MLFKDEIEDYEEDSFTLKLFEAESEEVIELDVDFIKKNLGCSGNC